MKTSAWGVLLGVSCPGLQDMVHTFPVKASRYSRCSPGMERGWSSTARHHWPKSCCSLGVQPAMWLYQPVGQPISRQDCALGRGGKAGEGKCFIRDTALSFVNSSGFTSSLQKAVETWGKANTEVAQQASKSQIWVFWLNYDQSFSQRTSSLFLA